MNKNIIFLTMLLIVSCGLPPTAASAARKGDIARTTVMDAHPSTPPRGGCLRVLFSACCTDPLTVDTAVTVAQVVHTALEALMELAPFGIREVYLLCQSGAYALSKAAVAALTAQGFLDEYGNLKPGWRELILRLLNHDGTAPDAQTFYFEQGIEDLYCRYPAIVAALQEYYRREDLYVDHIITSLLCSQYRLISSPTKITQEELATLIAAFDKYRPSGRGSALRTRATGEEPAPSRFRIRPLIEYQIPHMHSVIIERSETLGKSSN